MRESLRRRVEEALSRGDYRKLADICLEQLGARDWEEGWGRLERVVAASGEYVLAKFAAYAHIFSTDIYHRMSQETREFLARDLVVCIEKLAQVMEWLSRPAPQAGGGGGGG